MMKRWKALASVAVAAALVIAPLTVGAASADSDLCTQSGEGWSEKIDTTGDPATVTVTADEGFLIDAYCVKAGTTAVVIDVDPPAATVVIDHPDKDSVSHYQVHQTPVPVEDIPVPALFDVAPAPPTCEYDGSLDTSVFPIDREGYTLTVDRPFDGPGDYTITAVPDEGYVIEGPTSVVVTVGERLTEYCEEEPVVTSLNPPVVKDKCGTANDHYGLPEGSAGVTYTRDGLDIIATLAEGYTVTLVPEGWTADGEGVYRFAFDGESFTDEPCENVVPVPALFAAEPTPPTCDTAGSFDFSGTFPNVTVEVSPAYTGPGTYTLTVTAINGATFPDGSTVKTRVITVDGAIGFQSTDSEAPCYLAPPLTTTLDQPRIEDACGTANDRAFHPEDTETVDYAWASNDEDDFDFTAVVAEGYTVTGDTEGWVEGDGIWTYAWTPEWTNVPCDGGTTPPTTPPTKVTTPGGLAVTGSETNYLPWAGGALAFMLAGVSLLAFRRAFAQR